MEKQCLLILGNGYDLFRGYDTSYKHFINYIERCQKENTIAIIDYLKDDADIQMFWELSCDKSIDDLKSIWRSERKKYEGDFKKKLKDVSIKIDENMSWIEWKVNLVINHLASKDIEKIKINYQSLCFSEEHQEKIIMDMIDFIDNDDDLDMAEEMFYKAEVLLDYYITRKVNKAIENYENNEITDDVLLPKHKYRNIMKDEHFFWFDNLWYQYFRVFLNNEQNWIDIESKFFEIIDVFTKIKHQYNGVIILENNLEYDMKYRALFDFLKIDYVFVNNNNIKLSNNQQVYDNHLFAKIYKEKNVVDNVKLEQAMKFDFASLRKELEKYLQEEMQKETEINMGNLSKYFEKFSAINVVNFNYNKNIEKISRKIKSHNVHGCIEDQEHDIILGHNNIYDKNFADIKKENHRLFRTKIGQIGNNTDCVICILGHSLDENDFPIMKEYLDNLSAKVIIIKEQKSESKIINGRQKIDKIQVSLEDKISGIDIFYYNDNDKLEKSYGLIELFNYLDESECLSVLKKTGKIKALDLGKFK